MTNRPQNIKKDDLRHLPSLVLEGPAAVRNGRCLHARITSAKGRKVDLISNPQHHHHHHHHHDRQASSRILSYHLCRTWMILTTAIRMHILRTCKTMCVRPKVGV
ncbi:hypothetical protein DM02DRAFT_232590 [Periconia macrospinosa]|uniref:Uncharacterized protein n=1 Tax=Periconia macrospinosa TaxID=97972 RepID=A0A2V1ECM8_9PLEO|nr:hypothetical protein DM02DRAFT_232590 [Periconia macrospinosa]